MIITTILCIIITVSAACEDSREKFVLPNGRKRSCWHARQNPWMQCQKQVMKDNCPKACLVCPGDTQCNIKVELRFPQNDDFEGYHRDALMIEKDGLDEVCDSRNRRTNWNCSHSGHAYLESMPSENLFRKGSEKAQIFGGSNGNFMVTMNHVFSEKETAYGLDRGRGRSNLIVKVNGKHLSTIKHKPNRVKKPYLDKTGDKDNTWIINPKYNGDSFIDIHCDKDCRCSVMKKQPTCRVFAEVLYPDAPEEISDDPDSLLKLLHYDSLTVHCSGREGFCKEYSQQSWCQSYFDVLDIFYDEDVLFPYKRSEFINIPDAIGRQLEFNFEHEDAGIFDRRNEGKLYIYTQDGMKHGPYSPHQLASEKYSGFVDCDESCKCETGVKMNDLRPRGG